MAIDTAAKRLSALNFGRGILLPAPDGTIDAGDKATLLNLYNGFALDPPVAAVGGGLSPVVGLSAIDGLSPEEGLGDGSLEKLDRVIHNALEWAKRTLRWKGFYHGTKTTLRPISPADQHLPSRNLQHDLRRDRLQGEAG